MAIHTFAEPTIVVNRSGAADEGVAAAERWLTISVRSPAVTDECSSGESRNHHHQIAAYTNPIPPRPKNATRQPAALTSHAITGSANAAPSLAPEKLIPCARPRSATGSQL